jgi:murein DD-endopeptidase MepM/ murein hydrolase activator NlpD
VKLELFYPSKPFIVGQRFAENKACSYPDRTGVVSQLPDGTCPVGKVKLYPLLGMAKGHTGLDLYAPDGHVLRAPHDGIVKELQLEPERGLGVGIITKDKRDMKEHGVHYAKTRQWHGKKILVDLGQEVRVGQPVMLADSTGYSSGSHNHFELKPVEYNSKGGHYNVFQSNGWFGSIDPFPFFGGNYAEDYLAIASQIGSLRSAISKLALAIASRMVK